MSAAQIAVDVLLGLCVASCWLGAAAFLRLRDAYDRLHCVGFVGIVGGLFLTVAILVGESFSSFGIKTIAIAVLLLAVNALLTHATGRAFRIRETGEEQP